MKNFVNTRKWLPHWPKRYGWAVFILWTTAVIASLTWNVFQMREETLEMARIQARIAFDKDVIYRRWNAMHGGIYVPVTEKTPPNPYLAEIGIPERDITAPSGRRLTLVNPAYMTRQAHELEQKESGVRGHLTSLKLVRKENAPDLWETEALHAFERGEREVSSVQTMDSKEYMRLMRPLITEKACLQCHERQGYRVGDIRGGISISVPMERLRASESHYISTLAVGHVSLWLLTTGGIMWGMRRISRKEEERKKMEMGLMQRTAQLEAVNKELEAFSYSVSHDLRAPLRGIDGFSLALLEDCADALDAQGKDYLQRVRAATKQMAQLIDDLLNLSRLSRYELRRESVDLSEIAQSIAIELRKREPERQVEFVITPGLMTNADKRLIRIALGNLLNNAWKFTGKQPSAQIEFGMTEHEGKPAYYVRDNGVGFEMAYVERLFGAFQRLHSSHEFPGTGIGLATVQRIIYRHGGRVWAEGEVGRGAVFYFTL